jgi:hypothetical protein
MLGVPIDPIGRHQRPVLALVPGLPARLALRLAHPLELLARLPTPLRPRLRWIARRRVTAVTRRAVRVTLELLHPNGQRLVLSDQLNVLRAQLRYKLAQARDKRFQILIARTTRIRACSTHA